jgi:myo-inositol-hexaphosphate 3-phosphohydrolase
LPVGESVGSATFRVFATSGRQCSGGAVLLRAANDAWTEQGITWNNQPGTTGGSLAQAVSWTSKTYVSFDVTSAVSGSGPISFVLRHASGCNVTADATFQSREATNKPQLVVKTTTAPPQCSDGADNDGDGKTDFPEDPGCTEANDNIEADAAPVPQCSDLSDNDGDAQIDFPADPGCTDLLDNDETDPVTGGAVQPVLETPPVDGSEDVADDPAIWVHPIDPSRSLVIGTNKSQYGVGGLHVYDLSGQQLSKVAHGTSYNNVDVRDGFPLGAETVPLVAATNKSANSIDFFKIDTATGGLTIVGSVASAPTGLAGLCMYRSPVSEKFYAIGTHAGSGVVEEFELAGNTGTVAGRLVRSFDVGPAIEGCAVDDELMHLYVAAEPKGVWKYGAEPTAGTGRTLVDHTGPEGHLVADVEGIELWYGPSGTGWLLVSSQGESTFAVYTREAPNTYKGEFDVTASATIDDTNETDGIDVTSALLPPPFEGGLFVAHDHSPDGQTASNFKYVMWSDIATALGLSAP